jgi:hypothetical protein
LKNGIAHVKIIIYKNRKDGQFMNSFWIKMAIFAIIIVGLVFLVKTYMPSNQQLNEKMAGHSKGFEQVAREDDARLRAPVPLRQETAPKEPNIPQQPNEPNTVVAAAQPKPQVQPLEAAQMPTHFKELSEEDQISAQKLYELVVMFRKEGRLVSSYKPMVDKCREIMQRFPESEYDYKARRALADIPERFRNTYNITPKEVAPFTFK